MEAQVMNGVVKAGDRICYPCRQSSSMWMNIAEVVGVKMSQPNWRGETHPILTVRVLQTSGWHDNEKLTTVSVLDRVVKL